MLQGKGPSGRRRGHIAEPPLRILLSQRLIRKLKLPFVEDQGTRSRLTLESSRCGRYGKCAANLRSRACVPCLCSQASRASPSDSGLLRSVCRARVVTRCVQVHPTSGLPRRVSMSPMARSFQSTALRPPAAMGAMMAWRTREPRRTGA